MVLLKFEWANEPVIIVGAMMLAASLITLFRKSRVRYPDILDAAHKKDLKKLKKALESKNVKVNIADVYGFSVLIHALSKFGQKYIVEDVINKGANMDWQDKYGNTALHYAVIQNKPALVQILKEKGTNMTLRNNEGKTPLDIANEKSKIKLVEILN